MGLKPGNPDGTFLQNVPLAGITSKPEADLTVKGRNSASNTKQELHRGLAAAMFRK